VSLSRTTLPGIPGELPGVISALPDMGLLPGGHLLINRGIQMESTVENLEYMESSEPGDSDKGSRLEAPKIGATDGTLLSKERARPP
jgi:hypothetical protein